MGTLIIGFPVSLLAGMDNLIGRICVKLAGRDAGGKCVVVGTVDRNTLLVTGPTKLTKVRRREINIRHLAYTPERIEIHENASDEEVLEILQKSNLVEYMRRRGVPS